MNAELSQQIQADVMFGCNFTLVYSHFFNSSKEMERSSARFSDTQKNYLQAVVLESISEHSQITETTSKSGFTLSHWGQLCTNKCSHVPLLVLVGVREGSDHKLFNYTWKQRGPGPLLVLVSPHPQLNVCLIVSSFFCISDWSDPAKSFHEVCCSRRVLHHLLGSPCHKRLRPL